MCSTLSQLPPAGFQCPKNETICVENTFDDTEHRSEKKITSGAPYIAESQGQFYSAIDLGELAAELDTMERRRMAEVTDLPSHKMFSLSADFQSRF